MKKSNKRWIVIVISIAFILSLFLSVMVLRVNAGSGECHDDASFGDIHIKRTFAGRAATVPSQLVLRDSAIEAMAAL